MPAVFQWDLSTGGLLPAAIDSDSRKIPNQRDWAYDHTTGRFRRGPTGGRYFTSGIEGVRQAINIALLTFLGEFFLDTTVGVPYFQKILGVKSPNFAAIKAELANQIRAVSGVRSVVTVTMTYDRVNRTLAVVWTADTVFGVPTTGTVSL